MARLLDGRAVVSEMSRRQREAVAVLKEKGVTPALTIIRAGENDGCIYYERSAVKRCSEAGVSVRSLALPENISQEEIIYEIHKLNRDKNTHGVLLLFPLPRHIDGDAVRNALSPEKDIDGMTDLSLAGTIIGGKTGEKTGEKSGGKSGKTGKTGFAPCTASACVKMLEHYGIDIKGRRAVIIGRSLVVGKPLAFLLLERDATVTLCHSKTADLPSISKSADILISAMGRANEVCSKHLREGQVIIDAGINTDSDGRLCGDVNFSEAVPAIGEDGAIAPVPGGVGLVTVSVLAQNVIEAAARLEKQTNNPLADIF